MQNTIPVDQNIWENRFKSEDYVYGTEPNRFFKEQLDKLQPGRILLLGEGEGRNAVYAALRGWEVHAIDWSSEGQNKALQLARNKNVNITYELQNLDSYIPDDESYDAAGLLYLHFPNEKRSEIHDRVMKALKPDGYIIFEAFSKEQINYSSGGPKKVELLYSLENIVEDFIDLDFKFLAKEITDLQEGTGHLGNGDVIRFVGQKSAKP